MPAQLQVIAGGGIAVPLNEIATRFEKDSGTKVTIRYGTAPELIAMARSPFDLAVTPSEVFRDQSAAARLAPGPTVDIARAGLGVAVPAGTPKPAIGSPDALKQALLSAKSVATIPASAAGAQVMKLFERLEVADAVRAKLQAATHPDDLLEILRNGRAEIGLFLINVLAAPGLDVVGPVPAALDRQLVYVSGMARDAEQPQAARAFQAFLRSDAARAVLKARGLTPA
jgi:molybdate transport system substrate-binding protein